MKITLTNRYNKPVEVDVMQINAIYESRDSKRSYSTAIAIGDEIQKVHESMNEVFNKISQFQGGDFLASTSACNITDEPCESCQ